MPALRLPPRQSDVAAINRNAPLAPSQQQASSHLVIRHRGRSLRADQWGPTGPPRLGYVCHLVNLRRRLSIVTPRWPSANSRLPLTSCNTSQGEEPASRPMGPSRHPRLGPRAHGRTEPGEPPAALRACPSISLDGTRRLSADSRPTHVGVTCDFFGSATGKAPVEVTGSIHGPLAWVECIVSTLRSHPSMSEYARSVLHSVNVKLTRAGVSVFASSNVGHSASGYLRTATGGPAPIGN